MMKNNAQLIIAKPFFLFCFLEIQSYAMPIFLFSRQKILANMLTQANTLTHAHT